MVVDVEPLAAVLAGFVQRHLLAGEQADDEEGDDFLRELIGAKIVGAVRQRHGQTKGVAVSAHGQVGGGFSSVIRGARPVGRFLAKRFIRVEGQIAVHFAGRNVVEARHLGIGRGLQQLLRPHDIGLEKGRGIDNGQAIVRFRGKVDHVVGAVDFEKMSGQIGILNIAADKGVAVTVVFFHILQASQVAGVGEQVVVDNAVAGIGRQPIANEIGTDETGTAGDEQGGHGCFWLGIRCVVRYLITEFAQLGANGGEYPLGLGSPWALI